MPTLTLPASATARLHMRVGADMPYIVTALTPPLEAVPEAIMLAPLGISAVLTHDSGLSWPDKRGEALAAAILERGGGIILAFERLADAMACHKRLTAGRA